MIKNKYIIDLTQPLNNQTAIYPDSGDIPPKLQQTACVDQNNYSSYALCTGMHVGTHIDAPAHMLANGKNLNEYPVEQFCCNCIIIDAHDKEIINASTLQNLQNINNTAVLFYTGFDKYFMKNPEHYFTKHPVLTLEATDILIELNVSMIGFDMPSPDRFPFEIHKKLFANEILIIENLTNLNKLINYKNFDIYALPLLCATDGAPARVIAQVNK